MNKIAIFYLFILLVLSSCRKEFYPFNIFDRKPLTLDEIQFEYFTGRSKIRYLNDKESLNAVANIRIKSDSIIWISISPAMGIEIMRAILTKDTVYLVDRIHKEFMIMDFDSLSQRLNFKVTYPMLESVFMGNLILPQKEDDRRYKTGDYMILSQKENHWSLENYVNSKSMKIEKINVMDETTRNNLNISYHNFQKIDSLIFPYDYTFSLMYFINNKSVNTQVNISYSKVSFMEKKVKFPFNVPNKYEARDN